MATGHRRLRPHRDRGKDRRSPLLRCDPQRGSVPERLRLPTVDHARHAADLPQSFDGGDSAMEEANFLTKFASKVYVIHRRDSLRASKIMVERAHANPKIEFIWNTEVIDVLGADKVSGLKLRNLLTSEESERDFDGLFVAIGHLPRSELLVGQIDLDGEGYVKVESGSTRTNQKGVFACGDLVDHTYRQAITAAGSGCEAALDAERFLSGH